MDGTEPQAKHAAVTSIVSSEPRTGRQSSSRATVTTSLTTLVPHYTGYRPGSDERNARGAEGVPVGRRVTGKRPLSPRSWQYSRHPTRRSGVEHGHDLSACADEPTGHDGKQGPGSGYQYPLPRFHGARFEQCANRLAVGHARQSPTGDGHGTVVSTGGEDHDLRPNALRSVPFPHRERALLEDAPYRGAMMQNNQ